MNPSSGSSSLPIPEPAPLVVVVSGPSGVGKTVICDHLVQGDSSLEHSISATTRPRRPDEQEGVDYYFREEAEFRRNVEQGQFLEWAEVFGNLYGTPRGPVEDQMRRGKSPVLNVDVQGGRSVKQLMDSAVLVFLVPPFMEALRDRLKGRDTDPPEVIARRLNDATEEMEAWVHYDYVVTNDDLEEAVAAVRGILKAERARVGRLLGRGGRSAGS